jgi:asparagine synthase (glutamine-hydrolysing)
MCGIYGLYGRAPLGSDGTAVLGQMGDRLSRRGPDGGGLYEDGALAMGMRRLSIIDLKTGDQPLANEDRTVWVVFNGEIYNYRELTRELIGRGHRFSTASDTEVLVHLYEEQGADCVERLDGMFVFALWDRRRGELLLGRDRLGIKPLYYAVTARGLVFGSELKAVVASPWLERRVNGTAVREYLQYGYVTDPLSILADVAKLPPGHTVLVRDGRPEPPRRYWEPTRFFRAPGPGLDEATAGEELRRRLAAAVRSHLVSDVEVGAFLSGGVDSTAVVAAMAAEGGGRFKTFSVGFREAGFDELPYARRVAEHFGADHHEIVVEPGDLAVLEDVLAAVDEPFADASAIPTYVVSRLARRHVKVVLSGDGGDELFAGYDRYIVDHRRRRVGLLGDFGLGQPLRWLSAAVPAGTPGKNYLFNLSLPRIERYRDAVSIFPDRALLRLVEAGAREQRASPFSSALEAGKDLDPLSRLQALDLATYLPGDILTKLDRMSMANSLEARVPLLDRHLVEFACALPPGLRFRNGETKYLLRRSLVGHVPAEVLTRPKQGFAVPLRAWFSERLPGFFGDRLGDARRLEAIGVRRAAVQELLSLFARQGRDEHCQQLWALVVLDGALQHLGASGVA